MFSSKMDVRVCLMGILKYIMHGFFLTFAWNFCMESTFDILHHYPCMYNNVLIVAYVAVELCTLVR